MLHTSKTFQVANSILLLLLSSYHHLSFQWIESNLFVQVMLAGFERSLLVTIFYLCVFFLQKLSNLTSYVWTFRKNTISLKHASYGAVPSACFLSIACKMVKQFLFLLTWSEKNIILHISVYSVYCICTNLELDYLFFLLTVFVGVKIFSPVIINPVIISSGLNREQRPNLDIARRFS